MEIYTIYDHPKDYPEKFVIKKWVVQRSHAKGLVGVRIGSVPVQDEQYLFTANSLRDCQDELINKGLICVGRQEEDDPVIVESYI